MQKFLKNILEENEGKMNPGSGKAEHIAFTQSRRPNQM
jgi:hypothetical protein